jgi:hypothetical protein
VTQWNFAWPTYTRFDPAAVPDGDSPPTLQQRLGEWRQAVSCITHGTEPMGVY